MSSNFIDKDIIIDLLTLSTFPVTQSIMDCRLYADYASWQL